MARLLIAGLLGAAAITPLLAQPAPVAPIAPGAPPVAMRAPAMPLPPRAPMTRADVQARVQAQFAKRDTNRDGFLTAEELKPRDGQGGERRMMRRGGPRGGAMPMGDPNAAFDRIDANRDGTISRAEFAAGRQVRVEKRIVLNESGNKRQWEEMSAPGQSGQAGQPRVTRMVRHHGGGGMMGAAMLQRADANRDGRISLAEATGAALQHFDMMDSNRDGRITPEERSAGRARMMQMHKAG